MASTKLETIISNFEIVTLQPGLKLYHGSKSETINSFLGATWFSLDYTQSYLHALDELFPDIETPTTCSAFMHVYELDQPLSLIRLNGSSFVQLGKLLTGRVLLPFGQDDYELSKELCHQLSMHDTPVSGWLLYSDQSQVMICKPNEFVRQISSESIFNSPENFVLCELINTIHQIYINQIDPQQKANAKTKFDLYYELLMNRFPRPYYTLINPQGLLISGDEFDKMENVFKLNPNLLDGWQGLYIYDQQTLTDSLSSMVSRLVL